MRPSTLAGSAFLSRIVDKDSLFVSSRDEAGHLFIDADPEAFGYILYGELFVNPMGLFRCSNN
jgi:hypothetical protein